MKKHLKKLQEQPDHKKNKIVQVLAFITTIIIFIIYLILRSVLDTSSGTEIPDTTTNIFGELSEVVNDNFANFNEVHNDLKEQQEFINQIQEQAQQQTIQDNNSAQETERLEEQEI